MAAQPKTGYLTKDGAWCWFSDPRAIMVDGKVVTGWVKTDGIIEAVLFETKSKVIKTNELFSKLEKVDYNNPAFLMTKNG